MSNLSLQRCRNHSLREAVATCPECGFHYCRECITEHEDRVLCASCLEKILVDTPKARRFPGLITAGRFLWGFLLLWFIFYYLGSVLLTLPSSVHEGTVWEQWWTGK